MLSYYRNENIFLNKRFESYNSNMRRCCGEYALFLFRCNMRKGTEKSHLALLSCFLLFGHFRKSFANCQSGNHSVCVCSSVSLQPRPLPFNCDCNLNSKVLATINISFSSCFSMVQQVHIL